MNKYQITIKLDSFNIEEVDFSKRFNPPYYNFKKNDLLELSTNKILFDSLEENDRILKDANSFSMKFKSYNISFLSEKETEWFSKE